MSMTNGPCKLKTGNTGAPIAPIGSRVGIPYGFANMIAVARICPECSKEYQDLHPPGDCKYGITERIMET